MRTSQALFFKVESKSLSASEVGRTLLLLSMLAIARGLDVLKGVQWRLPGASDVGCDHIKGSSGSSYRWALQNPQLVAPVLLDYDILELLGFR